MAPNETRRHSCSQHRPKPHLVSVHRSAGLGNARLWAVVVLTRDGWDKAEFPRERELGSRKRRRQQC